MPSREGADVVSNVLTGLVLLALLAGVIRLRVITDPGRATRPEQPATCPPAPGAGPRVGERELRRHGRHLVTEVERYLAQRSA